MSEQNNENTIPYEGLLIRYRQLPHLFERAHNLKQHMVALKTDIKRDYDLFMENKDMYY